MTQRKPLPTPGRHTVPVATKRFPRTPAHPERTCWGCDRYCAADQMICGNGTERTQHPVELFGPGWEKLGLDPVEPQEASKPGA